MQDSREQPVVVSGGVKARLALYQEQCRKQREVKKHEELEVNKLNASLTDVSRFHSPTKSKFKPKLEISPTKGKRPAALATFQLELSPSARDEDDSQHNSTKNLKSPTPLHGSYHGRSRGDSSSTTPQGASKKSPARPPLVQKSQQVKDEEEKAAKTELSSVLEAVEVDKTGLGGTSEHKKDVIQSSFSSVRSRYLSAVKKLAPVDIKSKLSAAQDKQDYKEKRRAVIRAEHAKKIQYGSLKSAWDQYEVSAQDKSRDPDDEDEQDAREQLDKIEEAIDKQWIGFVEDVVEVVQKHLDDGDHDDVGEEGDLLYWVKESKRLKSESVARRRKKIQQRIAEEEQYWIEEAIKLRDQAKLKRSPDKGRKGSSHPSGDAEPLDESLPDLGSSNGAMSHYQSPKLGSGKAHYHSPKSIGSRVAEYTKAVSSSPSLRQAATAKEVEIRVEKYNEVRTRKFLPEGDDDDDDDDLDFWIAEAKRLQGKPKARFRNNAEEQSYWATEAKKLRDAVRNGKGPNPHGEVDDVEKAILEERIDRYNEIKTREYVPEDDEEDDLDFWIQEAKRLRGEPKTKFRSAEDEEEYWRQEAITIRESVRDGTGPNPYDDVHTVGARAEDESDSVSAFSNSVRSLGSRVVAYTKAVHRQSVPAFNAKEVEKRVQKYNEIKTRKYTPDDDDDDGAGDDDDLDFWIAEAKRLLGKPNTKFRSKAEEDKYWVSEAKKLRDAVRNGKGPNPYGEVDEVEKAILEERVDRYNEIKTRKYVPEDDEDDNLDFWIQEAKRLRGEPKAKFRSKKEEEEYWRQEAIKVRESVRNGTGPNPYDDVQTVASKAMDSSDSQSAFNSSVRSFSGRVAAYTKATRSNLPEDKIKEVQNRVQKYDEIKTRKYIPDDDDDDDDLEFWINEAKRLQGTPKRKFRSKAEEEHYWVAEAKKLREAIRCGRGPNPYGDVDEVEKAILEERVERYNEIQTRKYVPDDEDDDDELDFWIQEAKRLRGKPKKKFRSKEDEEAYWRQEAVAIRNSVRNGTGPNPYDDVQTVEIVIEIEEDDSDAEIPCNITSERRAAYNKAVAPRSPRIDIKVLGERVQKYNEIKNRKYVPEDDEDDDLDFWIQEAKRLKGDPKRKFKNQAEKDEYWKKEAIVLRESIRNGTGPNPYAGMIGPTSAEDDSDPDSLTGRQTVELEKRLEKYNEIKTRKYVPEDDDDDDLDFWIQEAKRLRGDAKKKFKNQADEDEYWKKEAIALRESIRNGTGPNPYEGIVYAPTTADGSDDDAGHVILSLTSQADELQKRVEKYNEIKTRKAAPEDADDADDDLDFWIQEAKRLRGGSKRSFKSKDEEEAYWRKEAIAVRESVRDGTGPSPYDNVASARSTDSVSDSESDDEPPKTKLSSSNVSPCSNDKATKSNKELEKRVEKYNEIKTRKYVPEHDDDDDDLDFWIGEAKRLKGSRKMTFKSKSEEDAYWKREAIAVRESVRHGTGPSPYDDCSEQPQDDSDESSSEDSCSGSESSSDSDRKKKKKKKKNKHKKKSRKERNVGDFDDSSSDSESDRKKKKKKKSKKSKRDDVPKTPRGLKSGVDAATNGPSTSSPSKSSKSKAKLDSNVSSSSSGDLNTPTRSSKLKSYMDTMSNAPMVVEMEGDLKSEQPRNLDGSLWKNPLNRWTNRPTKKVQEVGTAITMKIANKTDCWRKTRHNFIMDNAPYNWHKVSGDFEVMVKVSGDFSTIYDKAGLMVRQDEENWILTGMEYFNDCLNHSTSITRDYTDWSLASLPASAEKGAWFRLRRMGNSIETSYSFDTENWVITRQGVFSDRMVLQVGICGACPMGHRDMKVTFDYYRVTSI